MQRGPQTTRWRSLSTLSFYIFLCMTLASGATLLSRSAHAGTPPEAVVRAAESVLFREFEDLGGTIDVTLLPTRLDFSSCENPEAFLNNARVSRSGRIFVGLRCGRSPRTTRYLQAKMTIEGEYLVAAEVITRGAVIHEGMLESRHGDMTALIETAALRPADALGRVARTRIAPGAVIRTRALKEQQLIARGQAVFFDIVGRGFKISGKGQALQGGNAGDVIDIKTDASKKLAGTLLPSGIVRVRL